MVDFLMNRGVSINTIDEFGKTALNYALAGGDKKVIDAIEGAGGKKGTPIGCILSGVLATGRVLFCFYDLVPSEGVPSLAGSGKERKYYGHVKKSDS